MKTILIAVDLSPVSKKIIKAAFDFTAALAQESKIILFHALPSTLPTMAVGSSLEIVSLPEKASLETLKELEEKIEHLLPSGERDNVKNIEIIVKEISPIEGIQHEMKHQHADLLIIGSHGHGGLYHLFNGSVVTTLLKESHHPVMVIPVHH